MPEITVNRFSAAYYPVIEDANPNKNRLFINAQGFDETTLAPLWMQNWHFTNAESFTGVNTNSAWGIMSLSKSTIQCWSSGDTLHYALFPFDTYHVGLDLANYPAKRQWRTVNNKHMYALFSGVSANADTNIEQAIYVHGDEALQQQTYYTGYGNNYPTHFLYEDPTNNRFWSLLRCRSDLQRVATWTAYDTSLTGYAYPTISGQYYETFFLGVDNAGWPYFVQVGHGLNTYNYYQVWKCHPSTYAATQVITNSYRSLNENYRRGLPSNVRRATSDRRVFYGTHWDSTGVFAPIRYVFDAAAGTVTATNCTMAYAGADTYATHAERYTTDGSDQYGRNSWFSKGYQFTVSGVNYITFWICEMASTLGASATRWNTDKKRTMLTFTIGSGTGDDVLTYHSKVTFPGVNAMPRNFMAINSEGTQVVVPIAGGTRFYSFNPSTGWEQTGSYAAEFRQLGLDSSNRLWGTSAEKGFNTIHAITPSTPITVSVVMAAANYTYTGTNIATTAVVNAYDSTGARVVASINLTIDGSNMLFTSNSSKNLTVSTSASADTTVNLTISGGGVNNIVASVNF